MLFPPFFAFLSLFTLFSYADDAGTSGGLDVGQTILYVVLVLAFCAGLLIISKWSAKIRQRDEQLAMERAKFEEEQRQNGSSEASAEGEGEAAEAEEAEEEEEEEEQEEEQENGKESDGKPDGAEPAVGEDSENSCPPEDSSK